MSILKNKFLRNKDIAWRAVEDEALLVHPRKGKVYPLNPVGLRLWQLSEGALTGEEIVQKLLAEFEVKEEELAQDISEFANQLKSEGLLLIQ